MAIFSLLECFATFNKLPILERSIAVRRACRTAPLKENRKSKKTHEKRNKPVELQWTAFREVTQDIGNNLVFAFNAVYRILVG